MKEPISVCCAFLLENYLTGCTERESEEDNRPKNHGGEEDEEELLLKEEAREDGLIDSVSEKDGVSPSLRDTLTHSIFESISSCDRQDNKEYHPQEHDVGTHHDGQHDECW